MRKFQLWFGAVVVAMVLGGITPVFAGEASVSINRGEETTKTRSVLLWFVPSGQTQYVRMSESMDLSNFVWEPYISQKAWVLSPGVGKKTIYVQFRDQNGSISPVVSDSIQYSIPSNPTLSFTINGNTKETNSRYVDLKLDYSDGIETIELGNSPDYFEVPVRVQKTMNWILSSGTGDKTVYLRYTDGYGKSKVITQKIRYNQVGRALKEGTLLKGPTDTVYYYGYDGKLHAFLHPAIFASWYKSFSDVVVVSQVKLREFQVGNPVCMRPGTWLLRFSNSNRVFGVEPGCTIRPLRSEAEASILYGNNWNKKIMVLDSFYEIFYKVRDLTPFQYSDDRDRDGIDAKQEQMYGTSDEKVDSDLDGLSDYEEIIYWFSDPTLADTDGDKLIDGEEVLKNQSPIGLGELKRVPEGTYDYPIGSIIYEPETKTSVYRDVDGKYYSYKAPKQKATAGEDSIIPFSENFYIRPSILIPYQKSKKSKATLPSFLSYPVTQGGSLYIGQ